jgi:hypothetical protein
MAGFAGGACAANTVNAIPDAKAITLVMVFLRDFS